jgi:hypothetical protein
MVEMSAVSVLGVFLFGVVVGCLALFAAVASGLK